VSVNTAIDFYRAKKRYADRTRFTIDKEFSPVENQHAQYDFTESRIDSREIFNRIQELPDTTREVLNLFAIDGYSHREVAQMLNISEEASRWHLHKARKLMNDKLQQMNYSTYKR
jgi:RNA polymerase sigma-70 factor (ECF subfamily)